MTMISKKTKIIPIKMIDAFGREWEYWICIDKFEVELDDRKDQYSINI